MFGLSGQIVDESKSTVTSNTFFSFKVFFFFGFKTHDTGERDRLPFFSAKAIASSLVLNVRFMLDRGSALKNINNKINWMINKPYFQNHGQDKKNPWIRQRRTYIQSRVKVCNLYLN